MPGNYPEESIQHSEHGKSLKSGRLIIADICNTASCQWHYGVSCGLPIDVDKAWTVYFPCGYGTAVSFTLKECNILLSIMQYLGVIFNTSITQRKPYKNGQNQGFQINHDSTSQPTSVYHYDEHMYVTLSTKNIYNIVSTFII